MKTANRELETGVVTIASGALPRVLRITGFVAPALAIVFSALLSAVSVHAQQARPWEQISVPKLHDFKAVPPTRIELKNGIVLFLEEDHELPFVSGYVLVPGGSRDEDPAKVGLVSLLGESWRTSGSATNSGDKLDDLLEARAAHIETGGGEDSLTLEWDSLKGDSEQVFTLALDLLLHPAFQKDKLSLAKRQMAAGILRRNDSEGSIAAREAEKLVYGAASPYARQAELATVGAVSVEDLTAWHARAIQGRLIVAVSGDFDSAAMEKRLRSAFESLPAAKPTPVRHDEFKDPVHGVSFIAKDGVNQSNIQIVGLGTDRHNPDLPAIALMNDVLGGGFASRLFQKVRTELGLAYAVGGGLSFAWDHPGTFSVDVLTKSATTVDATNAAMEVLKQTAGQPFTEEEMKRAKDNILNSFLFRYDTREKILRARVRLEFYGYPPDYLEKYRAGIERVTVSDMNAAAKKYVHPEKMAVLVVGNPAELPISSLDALKMGSAQTIDITIPRPGKK